MTVPSSAGLSITPGEGLTETAVPTDTNGATAVDFAKPTKPITFLVISTPAGRTAVAFIANDYLPCSSPTASGTIALDFGRLGTAQVTLNGSELAVVASPSALVAIDGTISLVTQKFTLSARLNPNSQAAATTSSSAGLWLDANGNLSATWNSPITISLSNAVSLTLSNVTATIGSGTSSIAADAMPNFATLGLTISPAHISASRTIAFSQPCFTFPSTVTLGTVDFSGGPITVTASTFTTTPAKCIPGVGITKLRFVVAGVSGNTRFSIPIVLDKNGVTPNGIATITGGPLKTTLPGGAVLTIAGISIGEIAASSSGIALNVSGTVSYPLFAAPASFAIEYDTSPGAGHGFRCAAGHAPFSATISAQALAADATLAPFTVSGECAGGELSGLSFSGLSLTFDGTRAFNGSVTVGPFALESSSNNNGTEITVDRQPSINGKLTLEQLGVTLSKVSVASDSGMPTLNFDGSVNMAAPASGSLQFENLGISWISGKPHFTAPNIVSGANFLIDGDKFTVSSCGNDKAIPLTESAGQQINICGTVEFAALSETKTVVRLDSNAELALTDIEKPSVNTFNVYLSKAGFTGGYKADENLCSDSVGLSKYAHFALFDGCISQLTYGYATPGNVELPDCSTTLIPGPPRAGAIAYWQFCGMAHFTRVMDPTNRATISAAFQRSAFAAKADITSGSMSVGKDSVQVSDITIESTSVTRIVHMNGSYTSSTLGGTKLDFQDVGFNQSRGDATLKWGKVKANGHLDLWHTLVDNSPLWVADFFTYFAFHGFKLHGN